MTDWDWNGYDTAAWTGYGAPAIPHAPPFLDQVTNPSSTVVIPNAPGIAIALLDWFMAPIDMVMLVSTTSHTSTLAPAAAHTHATPADYAQMHPGSSGLMGRPTLALPPPLPQPVLNKPAPTRGKRKAEEPQDVASGGREPKRPRASMAMGDDQEGKSASAGMAPTTKHIRSVTPEHVSLLLQEFSESLPSSVSEPSTSQAHHDIIVQECITGAGHSQDVAARGMMPN